MWKQFKKTNIESSTNKKTDLKTIFKSVFVVLCIILVIWVFTLAFGFVRDSLKKENLVNTVSNTLWKDMKLDESWKINILLMWMWWDNHHGGKLADTIIVASWDPEINSVTMVSIPRDLYVRSSRYSGRINSLLAFGYNQNKDLHEWADYIKTKVEEVSWMTIPYYMIIDFEWFKKFIDDMWWLVIEVPKAITDYQYPKEWLAWYETFIINPGWQVIDGSTALKYVRSRHSTSDFDRSERQQIVLSAIKDQLLDDISLADIQWLYNSYKELVTTNVELKEIIWLYNVVNDMPNINSFWLTTECSYKYYNVTTAWCILYHGIREEFNWMAVILPMWASASNVSNYKYVNSFFDLVTNNQEYQIENPTIIIKNWVDKTYASEKWQSNSGRANKVATKLKKFGFNITDVDSSDETYNHNTLFTTSTGNLYTWTVQALERLWITDIMIVTGANLQDVDMEIVIGNDFIDTVVKSWFNYHDVW